MPFQERNGLRFVQFDSLSGLPHAVFTRRGGVSPAPWSSLNVGGTVGDEPDRVRENRTRMLAGLGLLPGSVFDVWQVHGTDVVVADAPRPLEAPHQRADAIVTDRPDLVLAMRFADCVPILLSDPRHGAVGIAHAGWMGTVLKTVQYALAAMSGAYRTDPGEVRAVIGPSIGPDHYAIGPDVIHRVEEAFPQDSGRLLRSREGATSFDLWEANRLLLLQSGVTQVEVAGICTACHVQDWFSHRAEHGRTGRFGALISPGAA
jgi:YfiH family protein